VVIDESGRGILEQEQRSRFERVSVSDRRSNVEE
jgi:hypothetical protein